MYLYFFPDIQCDLKMAINIFLLLVNSHFIYVCHCTFFVMTIQCVFMNSVFYKIRSSLS